MQMNEPIYTYRHWAKSGRTDQGRIHLLEHHLADVGACFEALLELPTVVKRLASSASVEHLSDVTTARLCVFAALHDIGKVNSGFQAQNGGPWLDEDLEGRRRPRRAGHTADIVPVLRGTDQDTSDWFLSGIGWYEHIANWDGDGGNTASALFAAAMSHHGEPLNIHDSRSANPAVWRSFGELDPIACVRRIGKLVRKWFPAAFESGGPPLPSEPQFQHMFLGLCTLADWIGSDEKHFPYEDEPNNAYMRKARHRARTAVSEIGLDISAQRQYLAEVPDFSTLFDIPYAPNAIQRAAAWDIPLDEPVVIIESETGSGKTEAALWRFARMYDTGLVDGMYFALPTRAAASQIHGRVNRFVSNLFPSHKPEPVLAVPGYIQAGDFTGQHLQGYEVWWDTHASGGGQRFWAAESAKRFLAAQIAVGTVDQAMMAALQVRHSHMRAACLSRNLLVVDEVHASDPYMSVILQTLLDAHIGAGGYALLMSATLGSAARSRWLLRPRRNSDLPVPDLSDAIGAPYPSVSTRSDNEVKIAQVGENGGEKSVRIDARKQMHDFTATAAIALEAVRAGAKVLVVRNTVAYAINTQQALEEAAGSEETDLLFSCNGVSTLHTGRFASEDRKLLDAAVEGRLGKDRSGGGCVVVGTQTLEQSLDIDADLLITDLCPIDVLLQRIGRLHRHERDDRPEPYSSPTCVVLTPPDADLSHLLASGDNANGLGPHGYVYPDLRILALTLGLVNGASNEDKPWRIPAMNRKLVESATHPEKLNALIENKGEEWFAHANDISGALLGDRITARSVVVKRDKTFLDREVVFAGDEERIRTRLGDEGVEISFATPQRSPFGQDGAIDKVTVRLGWLGGAEAPESVEAQAVDGGFEFTISDRPFRYDRLGLRRL